MKPRSWFILTVLGAFAAVCILWASPWENPLAPELQAEADPPDEGFGMVADPVLEVLAHDGTNLTFRASRLPVPGTYDVESATTLDPADWTRVLGPTTPPSSGEDLFTLPLPDELRFFRVPATAGVVPDDDFGGYRPHYQGFGVNTPGGRGGSILRVTNLDNSGPGSFREAITTAGPRIILFEVSGTVDLSTNLRITEPFFTIAGQSAPSPGITLNARCGISVDTNNGVWQHIRIRRGDLGNCEIWDTIWVRNNAHDHVFDHVSLSWGVDGTLDFNGTVGPEPTNISILDCILGETLECSIHGPIVNPNSPCHSRALLAAPGNDDSSRMTLARNYFVHNSSRNPALVSGWTIVNLNNLIYNFDPDTSRHGGMSVINGPGDRFGTMKPNQLVLKATVALEGPNTPANTWCLRLQNLAPGSAVFLEDNVGYDMVAPTGDGQWQGVYDSGQVSNEADFRVDVAPAWYTAMAFRTLPASGVQAFVTANAGARPLDRDPVDARLIQDVAAGTGDLIDSQSEVGGFPVLAENTRALTVPADPHVPADAVGRTTIELWLEQMARDLEPAN